MTKQKWDDYLKRSKKWYTRVSHNLLHSEAHKALKYGPALKVLDYCHEKIKVKKIARKRGVERYQLQDNGEFTFTYSEALLRGLTVNQFSRALKELYWYGFIDVVKFGSGMMEDPTIFTFSDRWMEWGKPEFKGKQWPKHQCYGFMGRGGELKKIMKQHSESNVGQHSKSNVEGRA